MTRPRVRCRNDLVRPDGTSLSAVHRPPLTILTELEHRCPAEQLAGGRARLKREAEESGGKAVRMARARWANVGGDGICHACHSAGLSPVGDQAPANVAATEAVALVKCGVKGTVCRLVGLGSADGVEHCVGVSDCTAIQAESTTVVYSPSSLDPVHRSTSSPSFATIAFASSRVSCSLKITSSACSGVRPAPPSSTGWTRVVNAA